MYRIRTFKAVEDLDSCKRFAYGHAKVLNDFGITKVTSSKNDWFDNPDVYVAIVENEEGEVLGGERIHVANHLYQLPIEEAVSIVEKAIYPLIASYSNNKVTGELCGLWNAKAIAGKGLSTMLTKFGVAIAHLLRMDSLFVLCAPYTVEMCQKAGFEIEESIGNDGTFYYPKLDLIATSLVIKDPEQLSKATPEFRKEIMDIVANPISQMTGEGPKGTIIVEYNLLIPTLQH